MSKNKCMAECGGSGRVGPNDKKCIWCTSGRMTANQAFDYGRSMSSEGPVQSSKELVALLREYNEAALKALFGQNVIHLMERIES